MLLGRIERSFLLWLKCRVKAKKVCGHVNDGIIFSLILISFSFFVHEVELILILM